LSIVFIVATAVIYDWPAAVVVAFLSMALVEMGRRRPFAQIAFNTGLWVCCALAAAGVAAAISGGIGMLVVSAFLGAAAFYIVNMLLLSAVVARSRATSFVRSAPRYFAST
jgi:hypothetical protein